MKKILSACGLAIAIVACNPNPKTTVSTTTSTTKDTAGLAQYQAWQVQHTKDSIALKVRDSLTNTSAKTTSTAVAPVAQKAVSHHSGATTHHRHHHHYANRSVASSPATTMSSSSANTATRRRGMSKAAKGAIIGGVVGAGTGAVIDKKNRGAGAVIGGVIGAGAGYGIGRHKDKKDGRY